MHDNDTEAITWGFKETKLYEWVWNPLNSDVTLENFVLVLKSNIGLKTYSPRKPFS